MAIYNILKGNLIEISEIPFEVEREIQRIVENNMTTIFNLDFVTSEFELDGLRIDSLGFDRASKSFTIIEYKRERNFSVIDQGYAYLSLLVNNKAEFILKFNENKNEGFLKKDNIDWSQSRVIFISPMFTSYQRKAIEFKDLPIELWEVKKYANQTVLFNKIQAPEKSESINTISQRSEVVNKVNKEVKVFDEEYHLTNADKNIKSLYDELKDLVLSIGNDVILKPKAKSIGFIKRTNFVDIVIRKSSIDLYLNLKKGTLNDPKKICRDVSNIGHWGNGDYEIKLEGSKDFGYILSLIRQSYDRN